MWNYSYIIPSIAILLVFLVFFFGKARIPVRRNMSFVMLLAADLITVIFDYFSTVADENYAQYSSNALYTLNLAFFAAFVFRAYCFSAFTQDVVSYYRKPDRRIAALAPVVLVISELVVLSSPFTGAVFSIGPDGYHSGILYNVIYYAFAFYLFLSIVILMRACGAVPKSELVSLFAVQAVLAFGLVIRAVFPHVLIMDLFCLIAISILFLYFENPDKMIANTGVIFNQQAFVMLEDEWHGRDHRILGFVIHHFNEYRGAMGSSRTDNCMKEINAFLDEELRNCYSFCLDMGRYALVMPEEADIDAAISKIKKRFEKSWNTGDGQMTFTVSFIPVETKELDCSADRLVNSLLLALDNAGREGTDEERDGQMAVKELERQLEHKKSLDEALSNDAVEVYLQPIIDSATGKMIAAEALARIKDGSGNVISPADFIPLAERDGQIEALGLQLFRKVCRYIKAHVNDADYKLSWINVNLSPYQFMDTAMADSYCMIMSEYGISEDKVRFEITEESALDHSLIRKQMIVLQEKGIKFILDDYGSGYSNLIRLGQYRFDTVKLDMEVVWDYCREPSPVLPAFVGALRQMGVMITAEGIEDAATEKAMREIGCDYLQGYYYSRPLPMEEFQMPSSNLS